MSALPYTSTELTLLNRWMTMEEKHRGLLTHKRIPKLPGLLLRSGLLQTTLFLLQQKKGEDRELIEVLWTLVASVDTSVPTKGERADGDRLLTYLAQSESPQALQLHTDLALKAATLLLRLHHAETSEPGGAATQAAPPKEASHGE